MGQLLPFAPSDEALTAAWEAADAATLKLHRLYVDGACSSSRERMTAALEASRLHRAFTGLAARQDAARKDA